LIPRLRSAVAASFGGRLAASLAVPAVALALAGAAPLATAATLGRLQLLSSPGQPLRAEVEVQSIAPQEAAAISARLAPADAFAAAGLAWDPALVGAQVTLLQRDGRLWVQIVSQRPVTASMVDLLLEVSSAAGRQQRSYSLLLDTAGEPGQRAGAPAGQRSAGERIDVQRGDTLSSLALERRPDGVTLNQAMVAIYRANPDAFIGNLNLVKAGASLVVPERAAMAAIDVSEANQVVRIQAGEFAAWRSRLAASAVSVTAPQGGQSLAGEVGAVPRADAPAPVAGDRLVLSRPEQAPEPGAAAGSLGNLASRAAPEEALIARDVALREAASRIADLERNVEELQKLLQLRSQTLAEAQRQVDDARQVGRTLAGQVGGLPGADAEPVDGVAPVGAARPDGVTDERAAPTAPSDAAVPMGDAAPTVLPSQDSPPLGWLPGVAGLGALGLLIAWFLSRRRKPAEDFGAAVAGVLAPHSGMPAATSAASAALASAGATDAADPIAQAERHRALGRLDEAEAVLTEALRAQPGNEVLRFKLIEVGAERRAGAAPGAASSAAAGEVAAAGNEAADETAGNEAAGTDLVRALGSRIELPSLDLELDLDAPKPQPSADLVPPQHDAGADGQPRP
jgi:pilus assembly protein FimV